MQPGEARILFQQGIDLFNAGEFFECHEVLEEVWTDSRQPDRWFLQSLIHFAVGLYHHRNGNRNGASRQLRKGLRKISGYLPQWGGVKTGEIAARIGECLARVDSGEALEEYPTIGQSAPWPGLHSPPRP